MGKSKILRVAIRGNVSHFRCLACWVVEFNYKCPFSGVIFFPSRAKEANKKIITPDLRLDSCLHSFIRNEPWIHMRFSYYHRCTGNFLPGGAVIHLPKNSCKLPKLLQNSRKETRAMQQHRPYWHMKVARYSFSELIPAKFEHKLRRHKQAFGKNCHHSCIR